MPPRKPRRDPTKTAEAFEALYFPEIMDRIFELAPYESLLVLRATCKGYKYTADGKLVFHVLVTERLYSGTKETTPWGPIPHKNWQKTALRKGIRILDLYGPRPHVHSRLGSPLGWSNYCSTVLPLYPHVRRLRTISVLPDEQLSYFWFRRPARKRHYRGRRAIKVDTLECEKALQITHPHRDRNRSTAAPIWKGKGALHVIIRKAFRQAL